MASAFFLFYNFIFLRPKLCRLSCLPLKKLTNPKHLSSTGLPPLSLKVKSQVVRDWLLEVTWHLHSSLIGWFLFFPSCLSCVRHTQPELGSSGTGGSSGTTTA